MDIPARERYRNKVDRDFTQGEPGENLDIYQSRNILITKALTSPTIAVSVSPITRHYHLERLHKSVIHDTSILLQNKFDGIAEFYIMDLEKRDEISFAYSNGQYTFQVI
jgi:hypothetical protein